MTPPQISLTVTAKIIKTFSFESQKSVGLLPRLKSKCPNSNKQLDPPQTSQQILQQSQRVKSKRSSLCEQIHRRVPQEEVARVRRRRHADKSIGLFVPLCVQSRVQISVTWKTFVPRSIKKQRKMPRTQRPSVTSPGTQVSGCCCCQ